jgi:AraC-like DNA-binding protein
MGRLIIGAPTVYRALVRFCESARSEASFLSTGLRPSRDGVWVWHRNETPVVAGLWHTELYVLLFMLKVVQLADSSWHPEEVRFRPDETPDRRRVGEALGCERLVFSRGVTEFLLPSTMLGQSVRPPRPAHSLDPHTDAQRLRAGLQAASVSESLNLILRRPCASEWWTMEELAEVVGVPMRTLQRHLREEGTCYSKIVREARLERAVDLLEASEMELREIASDLGFSTHSNFSRAFHQWSGLQPHEFRRRRRTSDPGDGARCSKQNVGIRATPAPVE